MSLEIALYTIFRRSVNKMTASLQIDPAATEWDCKVSTAMMATKAGVPIERLVACFSAMFNRLVCEPEYGMGFVANLKCPLMKVTPIGEDCVRAN